MSRPFGDLTIVHQVDLASQQVPQLSNESCHLKQAHLWNVRDQVQVGSRSVVASGTRSKHLDVTHPVLIEQGENTDSMRRQAISRTYLLLSVCWLHRLILLLHRLVQDNVLATRQQMLLLI